MTLFRYFIVMVSSFIFAISVQAEEAQEVSQYGITWKFDKPHQVGKFISGDWWVVGPVTIVSVTPSPCKGPADEPQTEAKSIYGASATKSDNRLRNGSMMILGRNPKNPDFTTQGYDSRLVNYNPELSVSFPCSMQPNQSLISTISSENYVKGKLQTPAIVGEYFSEAGMSMSQPKMSLVLETAAVLTCLDKAPPADAFRPPYAGTNKTIYQAKDIHWDLLPNLKPVPATPDWNQVARVFERPWLDHTDSWTVQMTGPGLNQPNYGGGFAFMTSRASLMLMLDGPKDQKEKLMIGYLQLGIDLHGLSECGRMWFSDGGHWMGRKWPIYFASILLDKPELRTFPPVDPAYPILYEKIKLDSGSEGPVPTTFFSEDLDTYYGKGFAGQTVLWQVTYHSHARQPHLEKNPKEWNDSDRFVNAYMWTGGNWGGFALSALYLKAKALWNHDAFFDYCDWYMKPGQTRYHIKHGEKEGTFKPTRNNTEPFAEQMWDAYRAGAPEQPGGRDNLKWVWTDGKMSKNGQSFSATKGHLVQNPKP